MSPDALIEWSLAIALSIFFPGVFVFLALMAWHEGADDRRRAKERRACEAARREREAS